MSTTSCIQQKIDSFITEANCIIDSNDEESKNEVIALIKYAKCIDLFDFLSLRSSVQKHEILVQMALIYDMVGYEELALKTIDNALNEVPNVPSIVLLKCGVLASMNKIEEAQRNMMKYKYLSGSWDYNMYVYDTFNVVLFYILNYEDNILIREIELIENKYEKYIYAPYQNQSKKTPKTQYSSVVLLYIKLQIYRKLHSKFLNIDKSRAEYYKNIHESLASQWKKMKNYDTNYLENNGISVENITKPLMMICNNQYINFKPRPLVEYKKTFNVGFRLFFTLFKINKIIKLKIYTKRYRKIFQSKKTALFPSKFLSAKKISSFNSELVNYNSKISTENSDETMKECQESIKNLCNSIWLSNYLQNQSNGLLKSEKSLKNLKGNYYVEKGYYNKYNLNSILLEYLSYNNNLRNSNNYLSNYLDISEEINLDLDNKNDCASKDNNIINDKTHNNPKTISNEFDSTENINNNNLPSKVKSLGINEVNYINKDNFDNIDNNDDKVDNALIKGENTSKKRPENNVDKLRLNDREYTLVKSRDDKVCGENKINVVNDSNVCSKGKKKPLLNTMNATKIKPKNNKSNLKIFMNLTNKSKGYNISKKDFNNVVKYSHRDFGNKSKDNNQRFINNYCSKPATEAKFHVVKTRHKNIITISTCNINNNYIINHKEIKSLI